MGGEYSGLEFVVDVGAGLDGGWVRVVDGVGSPVANGLVVGGVGVGGCSFSSLCCLSRSRTVRSNMEFDQGLLHSVLCCCDFSAWLR